MKGESIMNKKVNKSSVFIMRMSDERKKKLKESADKMGMSLTEFADQALDLLMNSCTNQVANKTE
jgi:predicted HicB family RNase H-like nuclease